jgi:hypothetical protein
MWHKGNEVGGRKDRTGQERKDRKGKERKGRE